MLLLNPQKLEKSVFKPHQGEVGHRPPDKLVVGPIQLLLRLMT